MCQFIETIRIEKGAIHHLDYHNERCNRTRAAFFPLESPLNLADYIHPPFSDGVIKCRIVYDRSVSEVTYAPYSMRQVGSLQAVESDVIDYRFKYINREAINLLFSQRAEADDVLIVRNELLTDTSIANIALCRGGSWFTPAQPLLRGTQRAALLNKRLLQEADIRVDQLFSYSHIALFNAMIDFGEVVLPVCRVQGIGSK